MHANKHCNKAVTNHKKNLNPIASEIERSIVHLKQGNIILYPTDTVWGIGCDARNAEAVAKIYHIKERELSKPMLCMVSDLEMLKKYVDVRPEVKTYLRQIKRPTTVIYPEAKRLPSNLLATDGSIAIRVVNDPFCTALIKAFGGPIVSTSANVSKHPNPTSFEEIEKSILERVDYIVNLPAKKKIAPPSRLVRIAEDGTIIILRE